MHPLLLALVLLVACTSAPSPSPSPAPDASGGCEIGTIGTCMCPNGSIAEFPCGESCRCPNGPDSGPDVPADTLVDVGLDAPVDVGPDTPVDVGPDAPGDATVTPDAGPADATPDAAPADATPDVAADAMRRSCGEGVPPRCARHADCAICFPTAMGTAWCCNNLNGYCRPTIDRSTCE